MITVLAGDPTAEEVAALVVALLAVGGADAPPPAPPAGRSGWLASAAPQVWATVPGPGAWVASSRLR